MPTRPQPRLRVRYDRIAVLVVMTAAMTYISAAAPFGTPSAALTPTAHAPMVAVDRTPQTSRSTTRVSPPVHVPEDAVWEIAPMPLLDDLKRWAAETEARKAAEAEAARLAAEAAAAAEAEAQAAQAAQRAGSSSPAASTPTAGSIKEFAANLVGGGQEWACLEALWQKESGWNHLADNPNSSAYGIPQALPGSKMASAGADWETNPETQVRWGWSYIQGRYGTACAAWEHSKAKNWY